MCLKLVRQTINSSFIMRRGRMVNKYVICVAVIAIGVAAVYLVANYSFSHVKDHLSKTVAKMYHGSLYNDEDKVGDFHDDRQMYDRDRLYKNREKGESFIDDDENKNSRGNQDSRNPDYRDRDSFRQWKTWRNYKGRFNRYGDESDEAPRYINDKYRERLYKKYGDSYIDTGRSSGRIPNIDDDDTYKLRERPGNAYEDGYGRRRHYDDLSNRQDETANKRITGQHDDNLIARQNLLSKWNNGAESSNQDFDGEKLNNRNGMYRTHSPLKKLEGLRKETTPKAIPYDDYSSTVDYVSNQIPDSNPSETNNNNFNEAQNDNAVREQTESKYENNGIEQTLYGRKMNLQPPIREDTIHDPVSDSKSDDVNLALGALAKAQQVPQYVLDHQDKVDNENQQYNKEDTSEDQNGIIPDVKQDHVIDNNEINQEVKQEHVIDDNGINQEVKQEHVIDNNGIDQEVKQEHVIGDNRLNPEVKQDHVIDNNGLNPEVKQEHVIDNNGINQEDKQEHVIGNNGINQEVKQEHSFDGTINNQNAYPEHRVIDNNGLNPDLHQEQLTGNNAINSNLQHELNLLNTQNQTAKTNNSLKMSDEEYKKMVAGLSHDEILKRIQDDHDNAHPFIKNDHRKYAIEHKIKIFDWTNPIKESLFCQSLNTKKGKPKICILDPLIDPLASKSLFRKDFYEQDLLNDVELALSKDPEINLIDIGANVGVYTITALQYGRQVLAVEPDYKFIPYLHKSIVVNNFQNRTTLLLNAISYTKQTVQLKLINDIQTIVPVEEFPLINHVKMSSITLDEIVPLANFDKAILKIDIPTPVSKAILTSTELFNRLTIPYIFMNWNYVKDDDGQAHEVVEFLKRYRYQAKKTIDGEPLPFDHEMWEGEIVFVKN